MLSSVGVDDLLPTMGIHLPGQIFLAGKQIGDLHRYHILSFSLEEEFYQKPVQNTIAFSSKKAD